MRPFPKLKQKEFQILEKLNTPKKIQDFLEKIPINFEPEGETLHSPLAVLRENRSHCLEGALLAAACFWQNGERPLLLDLKTISKDDDHVVALFKRNGLWGALSKTNHAVLRYRDPVFKTVRELALSYFNEYFLDDGVKTLREYSAPFSLLGYDEEWLDSKENLWAIAEDLDASLHFKILDSKGARDLRLADKIEIEAGKIMEWKNRSRILRS